MFNDRYRKTALIPFIVKDGELRFLHDPARKLRLREGAIGELSIDDGAVEDKVWKEALQAKSQVPLAHKGDPVLLEMKLDNDSWTLRDELFDGNGDKWQGAGTSYAMIVLDDPLFLLLRGEKKAKLSHCRCFSPFLNGEDKKPLTWLNVNRAYTHLSQRYEPLRPSHNGNAFRLARLWQEKESKFVDLEILRLRHTMRHEVERRKMAITQTPLPGMETGT